jgi:hypothetical protein
MIIVAHKVAEMKQFEAVLELIRGEFFLTNLARRFQSEVTHLTKGTDLDFGNGLRP